MLVLLLIGCDENCRPHMPPGFEGTTEECAWFGTCSDTRFDGAVTSAPPLCFSTDECDDLRHALAVAACDKLVPE